MKKWIALTLSVILVLSLCACGDIGSKCPAPEDENVTVPLLTKANITNIYEDEEEKAESVLEYDQNYNLIGNKTYQDGKLVNEITYDKDPYRPLVDQDYDEDGNKSERREYTYDKDGNQLSYTKYNEDGEVDWKYVYTYDEDGNMLTEQSYTDDEMDYEITYTYDEHGNLLTERNENGEEDWENTYENTYENGKLTEVKAYCDGTLSGVTQYDSDGNEILSIRYFDEEEESRAEYTYENGKLVTSVDYWYGEESSRCEYTYDEDGKLIQEYACYNGSYEHKLTLTYNDNGNLVSMSRYSDGELVSEITLTYESVTVSKDIAKKIEKLISILGML